MTILSTNNLFSLNTVKNKKINTLILYLNNNKLMTIYKNNIFLKKINKILRKKKKIE